jgi:hypothetical protein
MEYDYYNTPQRRYETDNHFRALVDMMTAHIQQCNYTPSEMREAAILASIRHEQMTMQRIYVSEIPKVVEECLTALHDWEEEWISKPPYKDDKPQILPPKEKKEM